jgi:hypothetical protein
MKYFSLALLAAATLGAGAIGSASAMPVNHVSAAVDSPVQHVRLVCNRYGRCYQTRRYVRPYYYGPRYYHPRPYYNSYGYYGSPGIGVGVGPVGVRVW